MNNSDKNNPRRLIRAIELATDYYENDNVAITVDISKLSKQIDRNDNHFTLYLSNTLENISKSINKRVEERFENGAIDEVINLYERYSDSSNSNIDNTNLPAFSATGVKEIHDFLQKNISQDKAFSKWAIREFQYAKRQLTWWRKNS